MLSAWDMEGSSSPKSETKLSSDAERRESTGLKSMIFLFFFFLIWLGQMTICRMADLKKRIGMGEVRVCWGEFDLVLGVRSLLVM